MQLALFPAIDNSYMVYWKDLKGILHNTLVHPVLTPADAIDEVKYSLKESKETYKMPVLAFVRGGAK